MKFSDLKLETQLHIITELSQLETSIHNSPFISNRLDTQDVNINDVRREELQKYNLTLKCLTNSTDSLRIGFIFSEGNTNAVNNVIGRPSNIGTYLNFNKSNSTVRDISVNFGGTSHVDGLTSDTPIESTINNKMTLSNQRTLRDSLEIIWRYTNRQRVLDEVSNVIAKLIEAYDIAMTLPEDLVDFIYSWVPAKAVVSFISSKIQHNASEYRNCDEEEPIVEGYDSYIIRNVYHKCGLEVMHATNSRYYNNYHVNINYIQKDDATEDVLSATVTFNGVDEILLKQVDVLPDLTVSEMVDFLADMVESIKEVDVWGDKLDDLIDHLHENIVEVKPFVLNALAG